MTDVIVQRSTSEPSEPTPKRLVDHLDPRLVKALTVIGFGLPILGYFWVVANFSVNVIYGDQLSDVNVIRASYAHLIPWEALWAQYQTNRLFFPNLIVVLLAHTTHFNIRLEVLLDATMLLVATALVGLDAQAPVAIDALALLLPGRAVDLLPGAVRGLALRLPDGVVSGAPLAGGGLDPPRSQSLTWLTMIGAIAAAIVGSFSSFQGLLIWPTGLVLLYHRRRSWPFVVIWIAAGVASAAVYFRNLNFSYGNQRSQLCRSSPLASIQFFLLAIGDVVGFRVRPGYGNDAVLLFGVVILLLAIASIVAFGIRRDDHGGGPVGVALICFGLLFAASITEGRSQQGLWAASQSRYTTYDLLILVGIYLTVLGSSHPVEERSVTAHRWGRREQSRDRAMAVRRELGRAVRGQCASRSAGDRRRRHHRPGARGAPQCPEGHPGRPQRLRHCRSGGQEHRPAAGRQCPSRLGTVSAACVYPATDPDGEATASQSLRPRVLRHRDHRVPGCTSVYEKRVGGTVRRPTAGVAEAANGSP